MQSRQVLRFGGVPSLHFSGSPRPENSKPKSLNDKNKILNPKPKPDPKPKIKPGGLGNGLRQRSWRCKIDKLCVFVGSPFMSTARSGRKREPQAKIQPQALCYPKAKIQNPKTEIQIPKSEIQNPKSEIQNPKSKIQNPQSKNQNPKC